MHRRLLPLSALASFALGCSTPSAPSGGDADASADAAISCVFCNGITPEELDASIAARVVTRLQLCNGQEGCHVSGVEGLSFPPGHELTSLVGVPSSERPELLRVKPGDPSASYLYLKVLGDGGIEGGTMPPSVAYDPRIAATFFAWIEAGAPAP